MGRRERQRLLLIDQRIAWLERQRVKDDWTKAQIKLLKTERRDLVEGQLILPFITQLVEAPKRKRA